MAVKIKPLEWKRWWKDSDDGTPRYAAETPIGLSYHASSEGWWHPIWVLNKCKSLEGAKEAAQADYEKRIRSALA